MISSRPTVRQYVTPGYPQVDEYPPVLYRVIDCSSSTRTWLPSKIRSSQNWRDVTLNITDSLNFTKDGSHVITLHLHSILRLEYIITCHFSSLDDLRHINYGTITISHIVALMFTTEQTCGTHNCRLWREPRIVLYSLYVGQM